MLNAIVMTASMVVGQVYGPPVYGPPVYVCPPPITYVEPVNYIDMYLGNMQERDRRYCQVHYRDFGFVKVPVINGYAPSIARYGNRTVYDYRRRVLYSKCRTPSTDKKAARILTDMVPVVPVPARIKSNPTKRPSDIKNPTKPLNLRYRNS